MKNNENMKTENIEKLKKNARDTSGAREQQQQQQDMGPKHTPTPEAHSTRTASHDTTRHSLHGTRNTISRLVDDILPTSDLLVQIPLRFTEKG